MIVQLHLLIFNAGEPVRFSSSLLSVSKQEESAPAKTASNCFQCCWSPCSLSLWMQVATPRRTERNFYLRQTPELSSLLPWTQTLCLQGLGFTNITLKHNLPKKVFFLFSLGGKYSLACLLTCLDTFISVRMLTSILTC